MKQDRPVIETQGLKKYFNVEKMGASKCVKAVDDISLTVYEGEVLGLVGESGCGKSTLGKTILGLYKETAGIVKINGVEWTGKSKSELRNYRKDIQIVFQDPYGTLDPRVRVGEAIIEPMKMFKLYTAEKEYRERLKELLNMVGLKEDIVDKYPHEFSGGQRQRIGIARALSLNPKILICDEPVSALDVSIQAQILNIFMELKEKLGLTMIFIAHGLNVVKYVSDRIGVMYLGKIVEIATSEELFANPKHPYTNALFSAIPVPDPEVEVKPVLLTGDIPSPSNIPSGCRFHTRCPKCMEICTSTEPALKQSGDDHLVSCHLFN